MAAIGVAVGAMLGSAMDGVQTQLRGSGLVIMDGQGRPVIDLGVDGSGGGRLHIRGPHGTAEVVLSGGAAGGACSLFTRAGERIVNMGPSPTGDGMVTLGDAQGRAIVRAGRWQAGGGEVWTSPATDSATP